MLLNEQTAVQLGDKKVLGVRQGDKFILGRRNLVQNGRAKYTSGTVEVWRNAFRNSGLRVNLGDWGQQGLGDSVFSNISRIEDPDSPSGFFCQGVVGSSGLNMNETGGLYIHDAVVSAGTIVRPSVYIKRSVAGRTGIRSWFANSSGTVISDSAITDSNVIFSEANQVVRIVGSARVAPEGSNTFSIRVVNLPGTGGSVIPEGATLSAGCVSTAYGDWFDGSYSPDPDLTPSWTGPENASASVLTGKVPISWLGDYTYFSQEESALIYFKSRTVIGFKVQKSWGGLSFDMKIESGSKFYNPLRFERSAPPYDSVSLLDPSSLHQDGTWHRYVLAGLFPSQASRVNVIWPNLNILGKTVKIKNVMCSNSDTEEEALRMVRAPYRDGDFPGWTWDGTPGQSASRGLS